MLAGEKVSVLSAELKILRKDLYKWRANFLAGGPAALRGPGRPRTIRKQVGSAVEPPQAGTQRRIAELERKLRQQKSELEAIRKALRQVNKARNN